MNKKQNQLNMTYYKRALSSRKIIRISERSAAINSSELGIEKQRLAAPLHTNLGSTTGSTESLGC